VERAGPPSGPYTITNNAAGIIIYGKNPGRVRRFSRPIISFSTSNSSGGGRPARGIFPNKDARDGKLRVQYLLFGSPETDGKRTPQNLEDLFFRRFCFARVSAERFHSRSLRVHLCYSRSPS